MAKQLTVANVKFSPQAFDELLKIEGIDLILHKTAICPNRTDIYEESHDINCTMCENGVISYDTIEFIGILQTSGMDKIFKVEGNWLSGSAKLTAPADIRFDYFDIIEVPKARARYNQLVSRGTANIDYPKYPIKNLFHLLDADNQKYALDADFEITNSGAIKWISNNRPPKNKVYTISYEYNPRFRVLEHLHFIRDMKLESTHKQLPQQIIVREDYLVDSNNNGDVNN